MLEYLKNKRILVVVAHPDDELLGLGATINKLINQQGCEIRAVILGEGITSRSDSRDQDKWKLELENHRKNIYQAQSLIGYQSVGLYDLPDNRFDRVDLLDIIKIIEAEKREFGPEVIFTHHGGDTNVDHQRTFEAVITSVRPMDHEAVKTVLTFETPSSTEWQAFNYKNYFQPNVYFGVSEENINAKIKGMESYQYEVREFPHPRSSEALKTLARKRGIEVGKAYAEAFMMIRHIS
ncbi:PIG-L family deacetylase [Fulvivirgaceae bacterium BMA12]|uniref:PIG-L family deacetylase n=1 Tax=Agaribacillus aureus TaxID=3051825 RepID=A0ABT8LDJ0_9BACT|nr:PIG-L family deacetylase [Fulvivirgaceae bacterium BMA12]